MTQETKIILSQKEFDAVKVLSEVNCMNINCLKCPLSTHKDHTGLVYRCFKDQAKAIVNSIENNKRMVI